MKALILEKAVVAYLNSVDEIDGATSHHEKVFLVRRSQNKLNELRAAAEGSQAPLPYGPAALPHTPIQAVLDAVKAGEK